MRKPWRLTLSFCLLLGLLWTAGTAPSAVAEESLTINLRGGGLAHPDDGYAANAGSDALAMGGGGGIEGGVRVLPRLWLYGSWSGYTVTPYQLAGERSMTTRLLLGHLRYRLLEVDAVRKGQRLSTVVEASIGGGRYWLDERVGDERRGVHGWGGRAGLSLTLYWRSIGYVIGYAYHVTDTELADPLGHTINAGGHEFGGGFSLRF